MKEAKEIRKKDTSFDSCIKKLEELTEPLKNSTEENPEVVEKILKEYINNPALTKNTYEFLGQATGSMSKEAKKVFTFLFHLFSKVSESKPELRMAVKPIYHIILSQYSSKLIYFLQNKSPGLAKSVLSMLVALCQLGQPAVQKLMSNFDLFSPKLRLVSNWISGKDDNDVRTNFITLVCAILKNGDNIIRRQLVQHHGFLNDILAHIKGDNVIAISRLLTVLQRCVVENKEVPRVVKQHLFNPFILKSLLKLYQWNGPKIGSWLAKAAKRKRGEDPVAHVYREASHTDKSIVARAVHSFLKALLCSEHPQHGIIVKNPPLGSSTNSIVLTLLKELPQAHSNPVTKDLVISVLNASPNHVPTYYGMMKSSIQPRPTEAWCNAMELLCGILSAMDPVGLVLQSSTEEAKVQSDQIVSLCLPHHLLPSNILSTFLHQGDPCITQWLLSYIQNVLNKLHSLVNHTQSSLTTQRVVNDLRTTFHVNLVEMEDLLETWTHIINKKDFDPDLVLPMGERLKLLLQVLSLYQESLYCRPLNPGTLLEDLDSLDLEEAMRLDLQVLIVQLVAVGSPHLMHSPLLEGQKSPANLLQAAICSPSTTESTLKTCVEKVLRHLPKEEVRLLIESLLDGHRTEVVGRFLMSLGSSESNTDFKVLSQEELETFMANDDFSCIDSKKDRLTVSCQDRAKEFLHSLEGQDKKDFKGFYKKIRKGNEVAPQKEMEQEAMEVEEEDQASSPLATILEKNGLSDLDLNGKDSAVRKALAPIWKSFVKDCLKKALSPENQELGASILADLHMACSKFYSKESSRDILAPSQLRAMVMGHSQFQSLFCSPHSSHKERLLDLLLLLCSLDQEGLSEKHIPLFLTGYRATLSHSDQKIFRLIILYNSNGVDLEPFSPFFWGLDALSHYQQEEEGSDRRAASNYFFELLNQEKLALTICNFPLQLDLLLDSADQDTVHQVENGEAIYDPRFLLRIFQEITSPKMSMMWNSKFINSGCLGLMFAALSSQHKSMQDCALVCLSRFSARLQLDDRMEFWQYLLKSLSQALTGRLPCIISQLLARLPGIMFNPGHPLYAYMKKTFMKKDLNLSTFQEFYLLYKGNNPNLEQTEEWVLSLLLEGLRTSMDFDLCQKQHMFDLLLARATSPLYSQASKKLAVKILRAAAAIPGKREVLLQELNLDLVPRVFPEMELF